MGFVKFGHLNIRMTGVLAKMGLLRIESVDVEVKLYVCV